MHKVDHSSDAHEAESTYAKAAKAELAREYDRAFRFYVKSAELYLHLSRLNKGNHKDESRWKGHAGKALQRAEKIKAFVEKSNGVSGPIMASAESSTSSISDLRLTPIGIDHFSKQEQFYVLKKGESVNGLIFPLWDEPLPVPLGLSSISRYQDLDGQPKLSPEQSKVIPVWRRPQEYIDTAFLPYNCPRGGILPQEILQHIVTDCSVCASISVCLEHARRFGSKLAESAVYNLADRTQTPVAANSEPISLLGGYDIKIFFNGAWRRIVIDDKLPYHPIDGTLMCMSVLSSADGGNSRLCRTWPSMLEKGYMKLMGGYDFPGSNSSIDLHAIAGWIPEHIEIKRSGFECEKTWDRIIYGFKNGHYVVTLGTGTRSNIVWEGMEVLASHSYAVVDVEESEGIRTLGVLDIWVEPGQERQSKPLKTMRIPWSDLLNVFDGIYLSWDPARWSQTLTFHGMWKRSGYDEESSTRHLYLNFESRKENSEEVWILLTRHVVDSSRTSEFISLEVEVEDELRSYSKAVDQTMIAAKRTYTNSTHVLVKVRIPSSQTSGVLSIFTSYDGGSTEIGFTLTVYAGTNLAVAWDKEVSKPLFTNKIEGVLTSKNAGGNCTYASFMLNPQYHLRISPSRNVASTSRATKATVALTMHTSRDIPVNIALVWSQGERIDELVEKELAASSGAYNYGLARVKKDLAPGDYTMILSAFEPRHMGPFSLKIECSHSFDIKTVSQEDAGMYTKTIRGAWTSQTARGGPTSEGYPRNPVFEINVPSLTQLKIRLQLLHPFTSTSLNITIFPSSSDGSLGRHIATSGAYNDAISGVVTPQITIGAGKYWAVPSTYNPGVEAEFQLIMYSKISGVRVSERQGNF